MGLQYSVAVNNGRLDAIETVIGASPILKIRTGAQPANSAAADSGSVLATLNLPSDWMAAASGGVKSKSGTWQDTSADAGGNAGHFRIYASDGTTCGIQGGIFMTGLSAWAASTAYAVGDKRTNGGNVYVVTTAGTSAGSGGPSGTGSAITDNTVTWQYVCPATGEMSLDNAQIGAGQTVSITSFSLTAGNT